MPDYFLLALIGHPLSHSLSPVLHNAALKFAGLNGEYRLIDIEPDYFQTNHQKSWPSELNGFNVTIPYKQDLYKLMSNYSLEAKLTSAVNTVKVEKDGSLTGYNTDLLGFKTSFIESFNVDLNNKNVLVVGAGGAAKAIIIGLMQMGAAKIQIKARDKQKVNLLITEIKENLEKYQQSKNKSLEIISFDQNNLDNNNDAIAAVINTSPIGLYENKMPDWLDLTLDKLPNTCVCFDLVYRKDKVKPIFTQSALNKNLLAIDGLSMLAHQAKFAFKHWTGIDVPAKIFLQSIGLGTQEAL